MSDKQDKKVRQVVRRNMKVELHDVGLSFQKLITGFGFRKRASIAWKILWGKSFLHNAGIEKK